MEDLSKVSFEDGLKRLEDLVSGMESGEVPLEDLVKQYEAGTALLKHCSEKLNGAELKIEALQEDGSTEPLK